MSWLLSLIMFLFYFFVLFHHLNIKVQYSMKLKKVHIFIPCFILNVPVIRSVLVSIFCKLWCIVLPYLVCVTGKETWRCVISIRYECNKESYPCEFLSLLKYAYESCLSSGVTCLRSTAFLSLMKLTGPTVHLTWAVLVITEGTSIDACYFLIGSVQFALLPDN